MRNLARQVVNWVALYAVALHVVLLGLVPIAANGAIQIHENHPGGRVRALGGASSVSLIRYCPPHPTSLEDRNIAMQSS